MTVNSGYGFPYPLSSEPVANGASNIQSLASAVDSKMGLFKVIPTGATNGTVSSDGDVLVNNGVSSVTVSGAFSSLYDNYIVQYVNGTMTNDTALAVQIGAAAVGHYGSLVYGQYNSTAVLGANDNNAGQFSYIGGGDPFNGCAANFTLSGPFLTKQTYIHAFAAWSTNVGTYVGRLATSTSYSSFRLFPVAGTISGGTIRVYGFRN